MSLRRRQFLTAQRGGVLLSNAARLRLSTRLSERPVDWVVRFPPGHSTNIVARILAPWLSERLPFTKVIVRTEDRGGTNLAAQAVVNAPPDGRTLLFVTPSTQSTRRFIAGSALISCATLPLSPGS